MSTEEKMNLINRLRDLPYRPLVDYGNGDVRDELDPDIAEAAEEIEQLRSYIRRLERLVYAMLENDPNDMASDCHTVLDVWREEARLATLKGTE